MTSRIMLEYSQMSGIAAEQRLGKAIQDARKKAGLTQQELCQKTAISYSTLAKIERGAIKSPSVFTVVSIASVCGVSVEDLAGSESGLEGPKKAYKTAKNGVEFVFFDINGCMVRFFQAAFTHIAADTGAPPDVIEDTFWRYNDDVCRGEMPIDEFNTALAERLGVASIDWRSYYLKAVEPIKEAQELLYWATEHYRVGLLSNIMPGQIDALMKADLLPKIDYSAIIDSSKAGAIKPEPEIFEIAEKTAGVTPEKILLIDDSRPNVMAAQKMGWKVLWFDDFKVDESVDRIRKTLEF